MPVPSRLQVLGLLGVAVAACRGDAETDYVPLLSAEAIGEHVSVLASDSLLGRGPGHAGGDMAVAYVAGAFEEYGLVAPMGTHVQPVPMVGNTPLPESAVLSFRGPEGAVEPEYLDGFVLNPGSADAIEVAGEASLVFVGYGIDAPEAGWDDFAGTEVAGKFILILVNDPPATAEEPDLFGGVAMTYYGRWTYKYEEAARQGALGALIVHETGPAGYPWSVVRGGFSGEQFSLPPDPSAPTPAPLIGWVTEDVARRLLMAGGQDFDDLKARAGQRGFTAIPTDVTVDGRLRARVRRVETQNVVGLVPGSERPDEYILVTSHYDHFGVGEPIDGDSIYNGAYDNASGTALLLEMARALAEIEPAPPRSVLFIATGAEEQGLLGAQWYVQSPLYPLEQTVAAINLDGANVWGETTDVSVLGEERSELGLYLRRHLGHVGYTITPEAEPEVGTYFRSDHFPFARAGVPALYIKHGLQYVGRPAGWGDSVQADYTANYYHSPRDEVGADWVYTGAARDGTLALLTILDLAATDAWPNWHEGQEFKAARDRMMRGRIR
jgi:Zn-dependent M28 family amino/carboxypeptidase